MRGAVPSRVTPLGVKRRSRKPLADHNLYDALGLRRRTEAAGTVTRFRWDQENLLLERDAGLVVQAYYGGPNEWWNLFPACGPGEHQGGIHRAGSPSRELFP